MRLRHRLTIFAALAASLATLPACHAEVDATSPATEGVHEAEPPPPSGAALLLIGVESGRNGRVALLRIKNLGETPVSYRACGAEEPRWTRQELTGDQWKDVAPSECDSQVRAATLLGGEGLKFRVLLRSTSAPTRVGVELVDRGTGGATVLWSETVSPEE